MNVVPVCRRLLWIALEVAAALHAQSSRTGGALRVVVVDAGGLAAPGTRLTLERSEAGIFRTAETNAEGVALLPNLPSGEYRLGVELEGFRPVAVEGVAVLLGRTHEQNIRLDPAVVAEVVEVRAERSSVDAQAATSGVSLGSERIEEGPSNRNYLTFVLASPGVARSAGSNAQRSLVGLRSARGDSGFTFGGMSGRNNSISIDGVDNRDEAVGGNRVGIGVEMVQEFRVSGSSLGAESGGAAGGSVNVVTRSGQNLWHGDFTIFGQTEAANARDSEVGLQRRPRYRKAQPGVSLLGPIRRDRTFFGSALEQVWESGEEWSDVPDGAIDSINLALASAPFRGSGIKSVERGLFPSSSSETEFSYKLDHRVSNAHQLTSRYAYSRGRISSDVHGLDNFADRSARGSSRALDHSFVLGLTSVLSPSLANDLRFQSSRRDVRLRPNSDGPLYSIPGVVDLGRAYTLDSDRVEDHWEVVDSFSFVNGPSQVSFGGHWHHVPFQARLADRFGGVFLFPTLDAFAAGQPDVYLQAFGERFTRYSTTPVGLWAQHRWQPGGGVTVDTGLRWDRQSLPSPVPDSSSNLSPRIGIAWSPNHASPEPLVIRAGFGLYYDRYPLTFLNQAIQKDGVAGTEQYLAGPAASRAFAIGAGGALTSPLNGESLARYVVDRDFPTTHSRKFTTGFEKGLGNSTKLSAEYSAVRGFHLPRVRNVSGGLPPVYNLEQTARASYHGLSASLERQLVNELALLVGYTVSRARDDASDFDEQPLDPFDTRRDWALSRQHQRHRIVASALFEPPVDDLEMLPKWFREAFEDFVVSPIITVGSRRPLNALLTTDALRTGAFPLTARPAGIARNSFFAPGVTQVDLRLMKGFWVREGRAILQVGIEGFNLLNHSNPLRSSPFFQAGNAPLASFGQRLETLNARQIQFMAQFEY